MCSRSATQQTSANQWLASAAAGHEPIKRSRPHTHHCWCMDTSTFLLDAPRHTQSQTQALPPTQGNKARGKPRGRGPCFLGLTPAIVTTSRCQRVQRVRSLPGRAAIRARHTARRQGPTLNTFPSYRPAVHGGIHSSTPMPALLLRRTPNRGLVRHPLSRWSGAIHADKKLSPSR
jgi:hypothetical protein